MTPQDLYDITRGPRERWPEAWLDGLEYTNNFAGKSWMLKEHYEPLDTKDAAALIESAWVRWLAEAAERDRMSGFSNVSVRRWVDGWTVVPMGLPGVFEGTGPTLLHALADVMMQLPKEDEG